MADQPRRKPFAGGSQLGLSPESPSFDDPDIVEVAPSAAVAWGSDNQNQKRKRIDLRDVIDIDKDDGHNEDDDLVAVVINGENKPNYKDKQPIENDEYLQKQVKDRNTSLFSLLQNNAFSNDLVGSSKDHGSTNEALLGGGLVDLSDNEEVEYDASEYDEDEYNEEVEYDASEYDEDEYNDEDGYDAEFLESDDNSDLAAMFEDIDLPPGVEAPVPWLGKSAPDEIDLKYKSFKQFDIVQDDSDHYFRVPKDHKVCATTKPSKDWVKKIQNEWKVLEKDLPETIYVRIYEGRMDLLRAVIVGPDGTPYHDGLFFFDIYFPPSYPTVPPMVHYHSGGLRPNPNLYECGKVCLSLLNTWTGSGCERWNPTSSTMLQVLVSIQALVLNAKPYFNEPGFASSANMPFGEKKSLVYNEKTFLLSLRTMLYSLRRPPRHFEDLVAGHFRKYGHKILTACKAYIGGAQVGCLVGDGIQDVDEVDKSSSSSFKIGLQGLFNDLLMEFTVKGADVKVFLAQRAKEGETARAAKLHPSWNLTHA